MDIANEYDEQSKNKNEYIAIINTTPGGYERDDDTRTVLDSLFRHIIKRETIKLFWIKSGRTYSIRIRASHAGMLH